jgi:hypothetical protein
MPIRLDDYTHDSLLQGESSIDEIKECHGADGTTVFFPVRAHRAAFSRRTKSLASQENLRVDEASLRVNIEVPDRTFALIPLSGERILNGDTGRYVTSDALPGLTGATTAP